MCWKLAHMHHQKFAFSFYLLLSSMYAQNLYWQSPFKIRSTSAGLTDSGTIVYCHCNYFKSEFSHVYNTVGLLEVYHKVLVQFYPSETKIWS